MTRLVVQIKKAKVKAAKSKAQWESRVIIISNRIRHVSFGASAYNQPNNTALLEKRSSREEHPQFCVPHGSHTQKSHETSIGGDLDTDPALRFRIGGSCIIHESAKTD